MNIVAVSAVLISALASSACATLKPTEATPEELQRELLSGTLIRPGDRVADVVAAAAGQTYYFQVDPRTESFGAFASGDVATQLLTSNILVNVAGSVTAVAAESHGKECGGAFHIYPVDAGTAITRPGPLRHTG